MQLGQLLEQCTAGVYRCAYTLLWCVYTLSGYCVSLACWCACVCVRMPHTVCIGCARARVHLLCIAAALTLAGLHWQLVVVLALQMAVLLKLCVCEYAR